MGFQISGGPCLPSPPQEFVWEASHYLVRQVFHSLQEMFSGTRAIQVRPPCPCLGLGPPEAHLAAQHGPRPEPGAAPTALAD